MDLRSRPSHVRAIILEAGVIELLLKECTDPYGRIRVLVGIVRARIGTINPRSEYASVRIGRFRLARAAKYISERKIQQGER
jgi:hypothetical protein